MLFVVVVVVAVVVVVVFVMASSSSAAAWYNPALATAQGNIQTADAISVATYNVGVRDHKALFSSKKFPKFLNKLNEDMGALVRHGIDVICVQELNMHWFGKTQDFECFAEWSWKYDDDMTVATFVKQELQILEAESIHVFPGSTQ